MEEQINLAKMEERLALAQARGNLYALLALCFYEPTSNLAADYLSGALSEAFKESAVVLPAGSLPQSVSNLVLSAQNAADVQPEDCLKELHLEYMRLFVGPKMPVSPPYESVHREDTSADEHGLMMGSVTVAVRQVYMQNGLDLAAGHKDLPDHIGTELEYMYYLCQREADAWEEESLTLANSWIDNQRAFLQEHLWKWTPAFCRLAEENTTSAFYKAITGILREYLTFEVNSAKAVSNT